MLEFNYYVVTSYVNGFPYFTTCAVIDDVFFRISNLEAFLSDGESGISNERVISTTYKMITSQHFTI